MVANLQRDFDFISITKDPDDIPQGFYLQSMYRYDMKRQFLYHDKTDPKICYCT
jgi:hypothetical protein